MSCRWSCLGCGGSRSRSVAAAQHTTMTTGGGGGGGGQAMARHRTQREERVTVQGLGRRPQRTATSHGECPADNQNTGRGGHPGASTQRPPQRLPTGGTRRDERVAVQGPVKKLQPDGMSHGGGGGSGSGSGLGLTPAGDCRPALTSLRGTGPKSCAVRFQGGADWDSPHGPQRSAGERETPSVPRV